jgi:hypothetical protein
MSPTSWLFLSGVAVFAVASFFFALAESSLFALGRSKACLRGEHLTLFRWNAAT